MTVAEDQVDSESAVRRYLLYVEDPSQLRDEKEIRKRVQAVEQSVDPIDKLKALAELERVSTIEEAPLREGFVMHAKAWAQQAGVPVTAFRDLKVADDVLQAAGFELPTRGRRGRGESRQRAKAVPIEDIKDYVLAFKGTLVLTDIMTGVGGSQATVRKAIDELIEAGQVEKLGPVPDYQGRGRAPTQYSRS
jgi:hypothetical protein